MPTKTFLNLPKSKQNSIIESAKKEFSNVLFKDSSINNIIKMAKISRGSFYMYFESKEDIYFYILKDYKEKYKKLVHDNLLETNGDIILSLKNIFKHIINSNYSVDMTNFLKKVFQNMHYFDEKKLMFDDIKSSSLDILELINKELFITKNEEEIKCFLRLLFHITMPSLVNVFMSNEKNLIYKNYCLELDILKRGFYR